MKMTSLFILLLLTIIDLIISLIYFSNPLSTNILILIHIALFIILLLLNKYTLNKYKGVANYLALFLPGLGWIIVTITYFSMHYFLRDSIVLSDYERYIQYGSDHNKYQSVDYNKEIKTLTFLDQMNIFNPNDKKQLIIESNLKDYDSKIKLLQKGLQDIDNEVKHYSAVTLNMIENEFSNKINDLREIYNLQKDIDILIELEKVYYEYIQSGLLYGELLKVFNTEYIEVLNKLIDIKQNDFGLKNKLVQAYIRNDNLKKALEMNDILIEEYRGRIELLINYMNILYKRRDFISLNKLIDSFNNYGNVILETAATVESELYEKNYNIEINSIPEEFKENLSYWLGKRM